jgi:hypothetical protein
MTNAQSKVLFSTSKLTEDRSFKKNVKIIDASSLDIKKLIADAENVSHALTLDLEGAFTPLYAPRFADKESEDDSEDIPFFYVVGNGSDEIPSNMILKAPASSCHHFLVLVSKADAIRAGVAVDGCYPIQVEKLTGTRYAGKKDMIILAPPSICPIPFGEKPIHVSVNNPIVAHEFAKLGREFESWYCLIKSAVDNKDVISSVIEKLSEEDKAKHCLNWSEVRLAPNGPFTILSPVNTDQLEEDSSLLQQANKIIDLFKTKAPSSNAGDSTDPSSQGADTNSTSLSSPRAALTAEDFLKLAHAMNSGKSDSESKGQKLTDEIVQAVWRGFSIKVKVCWTTGTIIGDPVEGTLSPGFLNCFEFPKTVRATHLKRFIESGFETPLEDSDEANFNSLIQDRCLDYIDTTIPVLTSCLATSKKCHWSPSPSQLHVLISWRLLLSATQPERLLSSKPKTCRGAWIGS